MMQTYDDTEQLTSSTPARDSAMRRSGWVFGGFAAVVLLLFAVEHRAHLLGWLPWLILLACPLMHLFMHGGHGSHGEASHEGDDR